MTDNGAVLDGYTQEVEATNGFMDLYLLVKPDADLDGTFKAWDTDAQEWILVNGWLWNIELTLVAGA
jgi:hypothetical protein